jgi:hypothetical protein
VRRVVFGPPHVLVDRLRGFLGATLAVSAAVPHGVGRPGIARAGRLPLQRNGGFTHRRTLLPQRVFAVARRARAVASLL